MASSRVSPAAMAIESSPVQNEYACVHPRAGDRVAVADVVGEVFAQIVRPPRVLGRSAWHGEGRWAGTAKAVAEARIVLAGARLANLFSAELK